MGKDMNSLVIKSMVNFKKKKGQTFKTMEWVKLF